MLKWKVFFGDFNSGKIEEYNVFDHFSFLEDCKKNYKKNKEDKEKFEEQLKRDAMYYFWSKCEWEIILSHWPPNKNSSDKFKDRKIDVYDQLKLNWDSFVNYLLENKKELK